MHARLAFILLAAALAGCGSTGTGLEATGRGTVPSGRISFDLARDASTPAPSDPHPGAAIELGYARGRVSGTQDLSNGQTSTVGNQTFTGPLRLTNEADMQFFDALFRGRAFTQSGFLGGEALIGLSHGSMNYTTSAPGQRGTDKVGTMGATVGLGGILRFRPGTSMQARYTWFTAGGWFTETNARRFDISFVQALGRNVMLRAGYASWQFSSDENSGSKLNAHLSGPTLGLELGF